MTKKNCRKAVHERTTMESDKFFMRVAGTSFRQNDVMKVQKGDEAMLIPDPRNPYDENAIKVMVGKRHVGYVPKDQAPTLGEAIKEGCKIIATVHGREKPVRSESFGILLELLVEYK